MKTWKNENENVDFVGLSFSTKIQNLDQSAYDKSNYICIYVS